MNAAEVTPPDWATALRTGGYTKTLQALRRTVGSDMCYCALGVLAEMVDPDGWTDECYGTFDWHPGPVDIIKRFPLWLTARRRSHVITMNDEDRKSFAEIADWVDAGMLT